MTRHTRTARLFAVAASAAAIASLALTGAAHAAPAYTLDNLGIPEASGFGNAGSVAAGISNNGTITGYLVGDNTYSQPFVYTQGKATPLPTLGGRGGFGLGVNDAGQVAGYTRITGATPTEASPDHAAVWTGGKPTDLGTLPGGTQSFGYGINAAGQVAGSGDIASGDDRAFRSSAGGGLTILDKLPGGTYSEASTINDAGTVAGYANDGNTYVGVYWEAGTNAIRIKGLSGGNSLASAINNRGQITGYADLAAHDGFAAGATADAILYDTATGQLTDLGTLGGAYVYSLGAAINGSGVVVGHAYTADFADERAFVYADGRLSDLNSLVDAPGWTLQFAYGINDAGQIVGQGIDPAGNEHAFRLNPTAVPEPASVAVAAVGAVGLLGRRRRRQPVGR